MTPALRWAVMRATDFNVSLIVRDKVTRQYPQTTVFEEKGDLKRFEPRSLCLPIELARVSKLHPDFQLELTCPVSTGTPEAGTCGGALGDPAAGISCRGLLTSLKRNGLTAPWEVL